MAHNVFDSIGNFAARKNIICANSNNFICTLRLPCINFTQIDFDLANWFNVGLCANKTSTFFKIIFSLFQHMSTVHTLSSKTVKLSKSRANIQFILLESRLNGLIDLQSPQWHVIK